MLDAAAPVDARDSQGCTPLFRAVWNSRGDGDTIRVLRSYGADPRAPNGRGVSPLKLARMIANFNVRQYFSDLPGDPDAEPGAAADGGGM